MKECENCGELVLNAYWRVFSGNDGELYGCPNCKDRRKMFQKGGVKR